MGLRPDPGANAHRGRARLAYSPTELIAEARRRRVFRTAGVYLVAVWGISQGAVELAPLFGAPEWALRWSLIAAIGFLPIVVILAWMFDIGRGGIVRDPQDVQAQQAADDDLAAMPTVLGSDASAGGVVVRWRDGQGEKANFFIEEFFLVRGKDCRVRFYDPLVSRRHARVFAEGGAWYIEDLGSRNGTTVAGERIVRRALDGTCLVRVNDMGPELELEAVPAGPATHAALSVHAPGQPTAHVRSDSPRRGVVGDDVTGNRGGA